MKSVNGIEKSDIVTVDGSECYACYTQFIKLHPWYVLRWAYKCLPNEAHRFTVLGIYNYRTMNRYDDNKYCIVVEDCSTKQIFLMGENGVQKPSTSI